ncbi:MAG: hypothetical protein IT314_11585 [Anaerolineales bacterium]|nr:hypothetical protein [Anaerolineales bacterium]
MSNDHFLLSTFILQGKKKVERIVTTQACSFPACFGGINPCLSAWKSAEADSLCQPEGLPNTEQAASAPLTG